MKFSFSWETKTEDWAFNAHRSNPDSLDFKGSEVLQCTLVLQELCLQQRGGSSFQTYVMVMVWLCYFYFSAPPDIKYDALCPSLDTSYRALSILF